jgi:hypothetical protein
MPSASTAVENEPDALNAEPADPDATASTSCPRRGGMEFAEHVAQIAGETVGAFPADSGIYAVTFRLDSVDQDPRFPYVAVGHTTEADAAESARTASSPWEARTRAAPRRRGLRARASRRSGPRYPPDRDGLGAAGLPPVPVAMAGRPVTGEVQ